MHADAHAHEMHAYDMHAYETHAYGSHAYGSHAYGSQAYESHAYKIHARERCMPVRGACLEGACPRQMYAHKMCMPRAPFSLRCPSASDPRAAQAPVRLATARSSSHSIDTTNQDRGSIYTLHRRCYVSLCML